MNEEALEDANEKDDGEHESEEGESSTKVTFLDFDLDRVLMST